MTGFARDAVRCVIAVLALAAFGRTVAAQTAIAPRVAHRVFVTRLVVPVDVADPSSRAFLARLDEFIYTSIAAQQPIVRVYAAQEANSTVAISIADDWVTAALTGAALGDGQVLETVIAANATVAELAGWVNEIAASFAPLLVMVDPIVVQTQATGAATVREQAIAAVDLADRLATPFEATLWGSGLMRTDMGLSDGSASVRISPVAFDVTWFPERYFGVTLSGWLQRNDDLEFGGTEDSSVDPTTRTLMALVGAGVEYRTLGRVAAGIGLSLYTGPVWITNTSGVPIGQWSEETDFVVFLEPGDRRAVLYTTLVFRGGLVWNLTDRWALRTRFLVAIHPMMLVGREPLMSYPAEGNSAFLLYLPIGVTYRFQ